MSSSPAGAGWAQSTTTSSSAASDVSAQTRSATAGRKSRLARLVLARVDPWSVMKLSFLLSIALAIIGIVAVAVLWTVLDSMGVFTAATSTVADVTQNASGSGFDLMTYVDRNRVVGVTAVLACVNVVLMTALCTLAAFIYNITSSLVGGLHVTLSEDA